MENIQLTPKEQQIADILVEAALAHRTISFSEIMKRAGIGRRKIGEYLSHIGHKCQQLELPIITVLAVYKYNGKVGSGYTEFEPDFAEHPELAEAEIQKVWANKFWGELSSIIELDCVWSESSKEGAVTHAERKVVYRDIKLRNKCLEQKGCVCVVCGFDPKKIYGEGFERVTEVHHLNPIANGEREVNVNDLVPVCANCHRALHAKNGNEPYTPEELKKLIK